MIRCKAAKNPVQVQIFRSTLFNASKARISHQVSKNKSLRLLSCKLSILINKY